MNYLNTWKMKIDKRREIETTKAFPRRREEKYDERSLTRSLYFLIS